MTSWFHDDVMIWKLFSHYWPLCEANPPITGGFRLKGQWCGDLITSSLLARRSFWINGRVVGDMGCHVWQTVIYFFAHDSFNRTRGWFNIKMPSYQYRKSHCGDKTILRPSYLHSGISYTGKMVSLYWIRAQNPIITCLWLDILEWESVKSVKYHQIFCCPVWGNSKKKSLTT